MIAANAFYQILIVGGGIANFTNVAATFKGIIRALKEVRERARTQHALGRAEACVALALDAGRCDGQFRHALVANRVSIYVRRGGPNYQEGLRMMRQLGETLSVPIHVYGPEMFITGIGKHARQVSAQPQDVACPDARSP